ncbi:nuclease-related domain-containing protein [Bacillus sp. JJ1773]|uniref:nuclease-related domain-containing protein n=1 Tax=Bacillus sp. JJ1773 TaxID=3122965 RepID=UPI002FFDA23A
MIVKTLEIPIRLKALDALRRRLTSTHPKLIAINDEYGRRKAGFNGEKSVYYHLKLLDNESYVIFHDLRLANGEHYFQIDFLLLTSRYALIIEAKNISGILLFDDNGQLIRIQNEKREGFSDPVSQAQFHQRSLKKWMAKYQFPNLPIDYLVIISKPSSIIQMENTDPEIRKRVRPVSKVHDVISHLNHRFQREVLDSNTRRKLTKFLLKAHSPYYPNLLKEYNLAENDIRTGVQCLKCAFLPMIALKANWKCPNCQTLSKDAHIQTIQDYFLLIGSTITNRQFRNFIQITSIQKSRRLLTSLNLPYSGYNKARVYFRPER